MKPWVMLLPVSLVMTSGCMMNHTPDCGTYDFDCRDAPTGPALVTGSTSPAQPAPVEQSPSARPAPRTDNPRTDDSSTGDPRTDVRVNRLERRLDTLETKVDRILRVLSAEYERR